MRYPSLIRPSQCKTPISITIYSGEIDEDGAPEILEQIETRCNYQSSTSTTYNDEKELITVIASAYFIGDILPNYGEIVDGEVKVHNMTLKINRAIKARNDDATVNYTKLELV